MNQVNLTKSLQDKLGHNNNDYLIRSVESGLSWKYLNIKKHGLGSIEQIAELIITIIEESNTSFDLSFDIADISYIYKPYLNYELYTGINTKKHTNFFRQK